MKNDIGISQFYSAHNTRIAFEIRLQRAYRPNAFVLSTIQVRFLTVPKNQHQQHCIACGVWMEWKVQQWQYLHPNCHDSTQLLPFAPLKLPQKIINHDKVEVEFQFICHIHREASKALKNSATGFRENSFLSWI
jgi:hypothetical protein